MKEFFLSIWLNVLVSIVPNWLMCEIIAAALVRIARLEGSKNPEDGIKLTAFQIMRRLK